MWLEFDIHGRASMRVSRAAPTASQLEDMFEPFLADGLATHDITVTGEPVPIEQPSHGEDEFRYDDRSMTIASTGVQVVASGSGFDVHGRRELLTTVLPLIDRVAVTRGAAMIHAATVALDGRGICLPAWGGVGKTSTVAKLVRQRGVEFMGDDWGFVTDDGQLLGFTKPMFIKPHHRPIYPHLFDGARKPLVPVRLSKPLGRLTTVVHPYVTRYPRLAKVSRRWSPEHMMVTPHEAFPEASIATAAPLDLVMFVERYDGATAAISEQNARWMVARMQGNFHVEMTVHSREVLTALGATGLLSLEACFAEKAEVLGKALVDRPTFLLRVPASFPPDHASDVIVEHVYRALELAGC